MTAEALHIVPCNHKYQAAYVQICCMTAWLFHRPCMCHQSFCAGWMMMYSHAGARSVCPGLHHSTVWACSQLAPQKFWWVAVGSYFQCHQALSVIGNQQCLCSARLPLLYSKQPTIKGKSKQSNRRAVANGTSPRQMPR